MALITLYPSGDLYPSGALYPGWVSVPDDPDVLVNPAYRVVAYDRTGSSLVSVLPEPMGWSGVVGVSTLDVSLSVTYDRDAAAGSVLASALTDGLQYAVQAWDPVASRWVEPDGARFKATSSRRDLVETLGADGSAQTVPVVVVECSPVAWELVKIQSLNAAALLTDGDHEGKRPFLSATPGMILGTLLAEYESRHAGASWPRAFDQDDDSAGAAWAGVLTVHYDHQSRLDVILENLVNQGACEFTTRGPELVVVNPPAGAGPVRTGALAPDLTGAVVLTLGSMVTEAPSTEWVTDLANAYSFHGGDGLHETYTDVSSPVVGSYGPWEASYSSDSVTDAGTAQAYLQAAAAANGRMRGQYVMDLAPTLPPGSPVPLVDYAPGGWITAPGASGLEPMRVQQVVIRDEGDQGQVLSLVLQDVDLEDDLRRAKRQLGIVGGSTVEGGSNVRPRPDTPDRRRPAAPEGLVGSSTAYIEGGRAWSAVSLTWGEVTAARPEDGAGLIDVAAYHVYRRRTDTLFADVWARVSTVEGTTADHSPYEPGSVWEWSVAAVSPDGYEGPRSAVVAVTMVGDLDAPPVPSAPTITYDKGLAFATWDGLTETATQMPEDFSHVRLWVGTDTAVPADAAPHIARRYGPGRELLPPEPYGMNRYARWQSVDSSGNGVGWSAPTQFTTTLIEGAHVGTVTLTATGEIQAVEPDGRLTRMRGGDGLQHLVPILDDAGGSTLEVVSQFGRDFTQYDPASASILGQVIDGEASFAGADIATDPIIAGMPLLGLEPGTESSSWDWQRSRGIVPGGYVDMKPHRPGSFAAEVIQGVSQVEVEMFAGRQYRVATTSCPVDLAPSPNAVGSLTGYFFYRHTTDGSEPPDPTPASTQLDDSQVWVPLSSTNTRFGPNAGLVSTFDCLDNRRMKILYAVRTRFTSGTGGGNFSGSTWRLTVEDIGPIPISTGKQNNSDDQGTTPSGGSTKRTYTTRWYATGVENYQGSTMSNTYTNGRAGQGWVSSWSAGPRRSYLRFTGGAASSTASSEVGKTISSALSGASDITVRYRAGVSNSVRSSVPILVGTASSYGGSITSRGQVTVPRGGTRWLTLPSGSLSSHRYITHGPGPQVHATYHADSAWNTTTEPDAMCSLIEISYTR